MRDRPRRDHRELRDGAPRPAPAHPPDVAAVLRMQAGAGNAATSRVLARDAKAPAQERTIVIEGVGTLPVLSFRLVGEKAVSVMLEDGPAGPQLFQASTSGTPFPSVTLSVAGGHAFTLSEVLVTSFSYGDGHGGKPTISVELEGASRELR